MIRYYRKNEQHKIENYELAKADNFKGWVIHHRLELTLDNEPACSKDELIRHNMYYNRPYFELIYLRKSEHNKLHYSGKNNPMYGKSSWAKCNEEERNIRSNKQRASSKGHKNPQTMRDSLSKIRTEANRRRHWYTDGKINHFTEHCPIGFTNGRTKK